MSWYGLSHHRGDNVSGSRKAQTVQRSPCEGSKVGAPVWLHIFLTLWHKVPEFHLYVNNVASAYLKSLLFSYYFLWLLFPYILPVYLMKLSAIIAYTSVISYSNQVFSICCITRKFSYWKPNNVLQWNKWIDAYLNDSYF